MNAPLPVIENVFEIADWQLSALRAEPVQGGARATILALPGGGYTSAYWHHPLHPDASLLTAGASLGYRVVALDRPGYGCSAPGWTDGVPLTEQARVLVALIDALAAEAGAGNGVFLIGHSLGGILALMVAAMRKNAALLGVDVSGVPRSFSTDLASAVDASLGEQVSARVMSAGELFYGPPGAFDRMLLRSGAATAEPGRSTELRDSQAWPAAFPGVAAAVRVPVQFTLGDHERVTRTGWPALRQIEVLFSDAPRITMHYQLAAGHNVSLHYIGRAYHLRAVAFFDEILAGTQQS